MARRYITIDGIGSCSVGLLGFSEDGQKSAQVITHAVTGEVFVLFPDHRSAAPVAVTSIPTDTLLRCLVRFEWRYAFKPVDDGA